MGQDHSKGSSGPVHTSLGGAGKLHCQNVFGKLTGARPPPAQLNSVREHLFPRLSIEMVGRLFHELKRVGENTAYDAPVNPRTQFTLNDLSLLISMLSSTVVEKRRQIYFRTLVEYPTSASESVFRELMGVAFEAQDGDTRMASFFHSVAFNKNTEIDADEFSRFLDAWPMVGGALDELFVWPWCFTDDFKPPATLTRQSFGPEVVIKASRLLDKFSVGAIDSQLGLKLAGNWSLLFSSKVHGGSFATLRKNILDMGSTVLIIKDKGGHVFGAFASKSWSKTPHFYGTESSFLFSVAPKLQIYHPRGQNQNFQYFNYGMEQLPNGLGMGGQLNYFGLFISDDYNDGHCKGHPTSSTYNNPVLSSTEEFVVDEMEVWRVAKDADDDDDDDDTEEGKKSILQGRSEDKALLAMAGIKMKSEGFFTPPDEQPEIVNGKAKRIVY